jgi:transcriptional regulator with XRE-family HTH domain
MRPDGEEGRMGERTYDLSKRGHRVSLNEAMIDLTVRAQIVAMRSARGWSQRDLARRAGLTVQTIIRLEHPRGLRSCRLVTLEAIARAFDVGLTARFESWGRTVEEWTAPFDPVVPDYEHDTALGR